MNQVKCKRQIHQQNSSLICTYKECDQNSRYLSVKCMTQNLHQHNQSNQNHIMDLKNLCRYILKNIKQHQDHNKLVNKWISQFEKFADELDESHNILTEFQKLEVEYEQACVIKKNALLKMFNVIQKKIHSMQYQQICVKCFNEEQHDHQEMVQQIVLEEQNFRTETMKGSDLIYFNIIDSAFFCDKMQKWVFQKPDYLESKIAQIKYTLKSNMIDQEQLNYLIVIKNQTYNINKIYLLLLQALEFQQVEIKRINYQLRWNFQLKYSQEQCFNKTYFCELNPYLPQFILSPNLQEYIYQNEVSNSIIVRDLRTKQIKKVKKLNKTIKIMKFSNDMKYFFCSDDEGYLTYYITKNYKQLSQLDLHDTEIKAFLPIQNKEIITYSFNGQIKITNLINKKQVLKLNIQDEDQYDYYEYIDQMNDQPNPIEYDEKKKIIFIGDFSIRMRFRKKLQQKIDLQDQDFQTFQLQLIQNNTQLLSCDNQGIKLWTFDGGFLNCINDQYIKAFKFFANDDTKRIIIMGKCFFEVLDYSFERVKIGNFDCSPKSYQILGTKFQIDKNNQCYIIAISIDSVEIKKRVLCLED